MFAVFCITAVYPHLQIRSGEPFHYQIWIALIPRKLDDFNQFRVGEFGRNVVFPFQYLHLFFLTGELVEQCFYTDVKMIAVVDCLPKPA